MKKILILSYFFSPCNITASNRVTGFAKNLNLFGIFPIIITRNWDITIKIPEDVLKSSGKKIRHEIYETHEVYYLPYKSSLRDRVFLDANNSIFKKYLSKFLTILITLSELISNRFIPFANLYSFSKDFLKKNNDINLILTSGNPFIQFKFCYLLSKQTGIPWIADYRDAWTTNKMASNINGINKILYFIQRNFERKWCSSALFYISVSDNYVQSINKLLNIKGYTILNGYETKFETNEFSNSDDFNIVYNGTLYYNQPIEDILEIIIEYNKIASNNKIHIHFLGLGFDSKQKERVEKKMIGHEKFLHITSWLPKKEIIELQKNADLLLMISYTGFKGIPSSKLYEYVGMQKNILLYPNDQDIIEDILTKTKLGTICDNKNELIESLNSLISRKKLNKINIKNKLGMIDFYSRTKQTEILAQHINNIIN